MRGEHDLSAYCLQDESSKQKDGDCMRIVFHDGEDERPAWAEGQEQRHNQHIEVGDTAGRFGVHRHWAGSGEGAEAGAARNGRGMGGRRGFQAYYEGDDKGKDDDGDTGDGGGFEDVHDGEENATHINVCLEGRQRFASSLKQSRDLSGWEGLTHDAAATTNRAFGGMREPNRSGNHGCTPSLRPRQLPQDVANSHANMPVDTRGRDGAGRAEHEQTAEQYARGGPVFFPGTDDPCCAGGGRGDSVPSGGACDDTSTSRMAAFPSPITTFTATVHSVRGGIGNRRRSSAVSEEILTAGARAFAEEAARASSGAEQRASKMESDERFFTAGHVGELCSGGERGKGDEAFSLRPEESTPTQVGARGVSTCDPTGYYGGQEVLQKQHQHHQAVGITGGASTPVVYARRLETPRPLAIAADVVDEFSPASVEGRFSSNTSHPPTPASRRSSPSLGIAGRGAARSCDAGFCSGSFVSEVPSGLPGGSTSLSPPRHRATVADVQEAFERADTRVARGQDQSESGEESNAAGGGITDTTITCGFKEEVVSGLSWNVMVGAEVCGKVYLAPLPQPKKRHFPGKLNLPLHVKKYLAKNLLIVPGPFFDVAERRPGRAI